MRIHWVWLISPLYHFTIAPFHHSKYTCYRAVWVQAMLILVNEFRLSTYVLTENRWIGGLNNSRTNNTLITYIYLCCIDTWKQLYTFTLVVIAVPVSTRGVGYLDLSKWNNNIAIKISDKFKATIIVTWPWIIEVGE